VRFEIVPDDFILSASLRFALGASLRLFEIVPDDFIAVFRLARHPPGRFSTNCSWPFVADTPRRHCRHSSKVIVSPRRLARSRVAPRSGTVAADRVAFLTLCSQSSGQRVRMSTRKRVVPRYTSDIS
jgi:hypothetical protein